MLVASSQPPGLSSPQSTLPSALLLLTFALALPIVCQSKTGPHCRLPPSAEWKSFTGHTVGIFVDTVKMPFSTFLVSRGYYIFG